MKGKEVMLPEEEEDLVMGRQEDGFIKNKELVSEEEMEKESLKAQPSTENTVEMETTNAYSRQVQPKQIGKRGVMEGLLGLTAGTTRVRRRQWRRSFLAQSVLMCSLGARVVLSLAWHRVSILWPRVWSSIRWKTIRGLWQITLKSTKQVKVRIV
jgi:hypothetical protein